MARTTLSLSTTQLEAKDILCSFEGILPKDIAKPENFEWASLWKEEELIPLCILIELIKIT